MQCGLEILEEFGMIMESEVGDKPVTFRMSLWKMA